MEDLSPNDKPTVERARSAQQFCSHPLSVATIFRCLEGRYVKIEDTLNSLEALLGGELDQYPEAAFSMVGTADEVVKKAIKLGAVLR